MDQCKPMLGNFVNIYENEPSRTKISTVEESEKAKDLSNIYCPLRINPVFYEQDSNETKNVSRQKRRAAKRFLEDADLNEEEDLPVETYFGSSNSDAKFISKLRERERYEEENFTRIQLTKRDRLMQKRMERGEFIDTNTRIDHIRKLLESSDEDGEMRPSHPKKKRKQTKRRKSTRKGAKGKRR